MKSRKPGVSVLGIEGQPPPKAAGNFSSTCVSTYSTDDIQTGTLSSKKHFFTISLVLENLRPKDGTVANSNRHLFAPTPVEGGAILLQGTRTTGGTYLEAGERDEQ